MDRSYQRPLNCSLWRDAAMDRRTHTNSATSTRRTWGFGLYLGRMAASEEHIVGTRAGIVTCRTVRRLPEDEQHDRQLLLGMTGVPWDMRGKLAAQPPTERTPGTPSSRAIPGTPV
eukprot:5849396-Amphidinium_carterae.1